MQAFYSFQFTVVQFITSTESSCIKKLPGRKLTGSIVIHKMKITQSSANQFIRLSTIFIVWMIVMLMPGEVLFDDTQLVCIHKYLFGFECPLCGMTRAVYQFSHFKFLSAVNYNFVVIFLPLYLVFDFGTIFNPQRWVTVVRKTIFILIGISLALLYAFRIIDHFNQL